MKEDIEKIEELEHNLPSSSEELDENEEGIIKKKFNPIQPNIISNQELQEILMPNEAEALDKFKKENPELVENKSDVFIILFLWARKLDLVRTKELLTNHNKWRVKYEIDNINVGLSIFAYLKIFFFNFFIFFFFFFFFYFSF